MLLGLALIVNAVLLWPEIRIERVPVNDLSFHIAASQRLANSLSTGDSFLDPWMSQWALGYPLWHFYQPLPHMIAGLWLTITSHFASAPASFAVLYYLLDDSTAGVHLSGRAIIRAGAGRRRIRIDSYHRRQ